MKKNLIVAIALILIATHVIPPYNISFANEEDSKCELIDFTIQTIKENDDKLEGKASANQEFTIEFIRQTELEKITSDNNGKMEFKFEKNYLKQNDKIIISNDSHKVETTVVSDIENAKEIRSESYTECVLGKEDTESEAVGEVSEEDTGSEAVGEVSEEDTGSEVVDEVSEEDIESEVVDEVSEEDIESEVVDEISEEDTESEVVGEVIEEDTGYEVVDEISEEDTESEAVGEVSEEDTESEAVGEVSEEDTESEAVDEISEEDTGSEAIDEISEGESILKEDKKFDIDSSALEEHTSKKTDNSNGKNNKTQEKNVRDDLLTPRIFLESKLNYKVRDTSVDSYNITKNVLAKDIKEVGNNNFKSALEDRSVEYIILTEDIKVNGEIDVKSESAVKIIDGHGKYTVDFGKGQLYLNSDVFDLVWPREVKKFHLKNIPNITTENISDNNGLIRKQSRFSEIHLENVNFNRDNLKNAGMLGSSWESEIHFHGENTINSNSGNYVMAFSNIIVRENSSLTINNNNNKTVFYYDNSLVTANPKSYGIRIDTNGKLNINSNSLIVDSKLSGSNQLDYRFGINSEVHIQGNGNNIFNSSKDSDMYILNPKKIDLINLSNNLLFNDNKKIRFIIEDATFKGWSVGNSSEKPSNISESIKNGQFTIDGKKITTKDLQNNFSNFFKDIQRRIVFDKNITPIDSLGIDDIYFGDTVIKGTTAPNAVVNMYDNKGMVLGSTESDNSGKFKITVKEPLKLDQELIFIANISHVQSPEVQKVVLGTELTVPESIKFKRTEISTSEKKVFREKDDLKVSVFDNRPNVDWKLTVKAPPLRYQANEIKNSLFYVENNEWKSIEEDAVTVANESDFDSDLKKKEISWGASEGILLKLNPIRAQADTEYSTTIEWTLTDGP